MIELGFARLMVIILRAHCCRNHAGNIITSSAKHRHGLKERPLMTGSRDKREAIDHLEILMVVLFARKLN